MALAGPGASGAVICAGWECALELSTVTPIYTDTQRLDMQAFNPQTLWQRLFSAKMASALTQLVGTGQTSLVSSKQVDGGKHAVGPHSH